jgi:hypothetical protein
MTASCIAGQTTTWGGTPEILTVRPQPGAGMLSRFYQANEFVQAPSFLGEPPLPSSQVDLLAADSYEQAEGEDEKNQQNDQFRCYQSFMAMPS